MGTKIRSIERKHVPGGVELIARGQSNRGTAYISGSVVVLRGELSVEDFRVAIQRAIATMMSS